jgi:hypothetical protein
MVLTDFNSTHKCVRNLVSRLFKLSTQKLHKTLTFSRNHVVVKMFTALAEKLLLASLQGLICLNRSRYLTYDHLTLCSSHNSFLLLYRTHDTITKDSVYNKLTQLNKTLLLCHPCQ